MERISWNQYFMAQSHLLSYRSTCTRLAVGATIVRDKRIIAGGYNGSITGDEHCIDKGCYVIDHHCVRTIHAEMNAILQCAKFGVPTNGAEIYVTHFPCLQCCKAIIQAGIRSVYYSHEYKNHPYAIELFQKAGVDIEQVEFEQNRFGINLHNKNKTEDKKVFVDSLLDKLKERGMNEKELKMIQHEAKELF